MSLQVRSAAASQRLERLLATWSEPDSLRQARARELLAICQGFPARLAGLPRDANGDAGLAAMAHQLAVVEGFLRDHCAPMDLAQAPVSTAPESASDPVPAPVAKGVAIEKPRGLAGPNPTS